MTTWARGSEQPVIWESSAYHRGGYAYRLCKVNDGKYWEVNEQCFKDGHLKFAGKFCSKLAQSHLKTFSEAMSKFHFEYCFYSTLQETKPGDIRYWIPPSQKLKLVKRGLMLGIHKICRG